MSRRGGCRSRRPSRAARRPPRSPPTAPAVQWCPWSRGGRGVARVSVVSAGTDRDCAHQKDRCQEDGQAHRRILPAPAVTLSHLPDLFISSRRRRRRLTIAGAVVGVLAVGALIAFLVLRGNTGDVHKGEQVEFQPEAPPKPVEEKTTDWPFYHRDLAHTGFLPSRLSPPFRRRWLLGGKVLMEFPPDHCRSTHFSSCGTTAARTALGARHRHGQMEEPNREAVGLVARLLEWPRLRRLR